jgi:aminoglycoside phosphotransferase (APT) family kinase protein
MNRARRLPGKVLHPALDVNWHVIGRALGRAAAQLHAIHFPHAGEWRADLDDIASPELSAPEWFELRVADLEQRIAQTSSALDATSAALVDRRVAGAASAIGNFEPTYVHGDLGMGNLVGERTSHGFRFTGVFDLGGGFAGDPDEDLATPICGRCIGGIGLRHGHSLIAIGFNAHRVQARRRGFALT